MEYTIQELGDCLFNHLSLNADKYLSSSKIFTDITGKTGHRCPELAKHPRRYVGAYCETLAGLIDSYKGIDSISRNGREYWRFSTSDSIDTSYLDDIEYEDCDDCDNLNKFTSCYVPEHPKLTKKICSLKNENSALIKSVENKKKRIESLLIENRMLVEKCKDEWEIKKNLYMTIAALVLIIFMLITY